MTRLCGSYTNLRFSPVTGKTTFFVYNQAKIDCLPNEKINELKSEVSKIEDENQALSGDLKAYTAGKV